MIGHEAIIAALLVAAIPFSLSHVRDVIAIFIVAFVLLLLPSMLPKPETLGETWYWLLIMVEMFFASAALATRALSGRIIALFCIWNTAGHIMGLMAFHYYWSISEYYSAIIRAGELSQAVALVLFSGPIINFAVRRRTQRQENRDEWHRLEHSHPRNY